MDYSFNQSFSRFSASDYTNPNVSLPRTMNSFSSLDLDVQRDQENQSKGMYTPSTVLLFKGIPDDAKEIEILGLCQSFGVLKDVLIARHKRYAFVQFETIEQAANCYNAFMKFPPNLRGYNLYVFYTGKERINKPDTLIGPPSRFLLFVFGKDTRNIDQNIISHLLKPFGKCLQIVLFQTKTLQAFVEMQDVIQAIMTKESLDGKIIMDSTHITVFYSEEKDFFDEKETGFSSLLSLGNQPQPLRNMPYSMPEISFKPKELSMMNPYGPTGHSYPNIDPHQNRLTKLASSDQLNKTMSLLSPLLHVKEEKANNILMVKNLPKNVTARMLFLLFGMYGNVMKVKIFYKNPENALVEFQDEYQANLAKGFLNNCPLYGNNIFITNSKQGVVIDTSGLKKGEETQFMGDYTTSTEHRYKFAGSKNHFNIAPPSKVLHLSNLCEDKGEDFYRELFKSHAIIRKFIFLKSTDRMALMETDKISEAVDILINFHNYNIDGKYLKVSFSKYPKIKEFK